ncbi:zinc finger protein 677-like isoform X2 [Toxorhynchites rutilus septentrionalis]|uniref:zinc finger protein 677-like isoform X2 n=1 Tax=Toxorhynchites rutilus septentrionalis TaxID=329112 RepID=UPI00247A6E5F|nr:zinc finger protein 677-like isoform X2 [Toxorhynchites rutilus septentrionalis]
MVCIVPFCVPPNRDEFFVRFPRNSKLAERWKIAIELGTGNALDNIERLEEATICNTHFKENASGGINFYQEPCRFWNGVKNQYSYVVCCRICLQFTTESSSMDDLASDTGFLLGIHPLEGDFLKSTCISCSEKLNTMRMIINEATETNARFIILSEYIKYETVTIINRRQKAELPKIEYSESNTAVGANNVNPTQEDIKSLTRRKCYICPSVQESADQLLSHLVSSHHQNEVFLCNQCDPPKSFARIDLYNFHLSYHCPEDRPFKCGFCSIHFAVVQSRIRHEKSHHRANGKMSPCVSHRTKHQCEHCGNIYRSKHLLEVHMGLTHGIKTINVPSCHICGKKFSSSTNLRRHVATHGPGGLVKCRICEEIFRTELQLEKHRLDAHKLDVPRRRKLSKTTCVICGQEQKGIFALGAHVKESHNEEEYPYFRCDKCPEMFLTEAKATEHRNVHNGKHECNVCFKRFVLASTLWSHKIRVHGNQSHFQCDACGRMFSSKGNMMRHMTEHTGSKEFKCESCENCFTRKSSLDNHSKKCSSCTLRFCRRGALLKHHRECHNINNVGQTSAVDPGASRLGSQRAVFVISRSTSVSFI